MANNPNDNDDTASKQGSVYSLGYNSTERSRLLAQDAAFLALLGTPPLSSHVKPSRIHKIIDIGCGVNASNSLLFARTFPSAKVYGVDLSPISVSDRPSNLEFIQGNILHLLADGKDERLKEGSFDLGYIEAVAKLLKPGGVLEMQDIAEWEFYLGDVPSSSSSSTMKPISQTENWQWPRFALEKMTAPPSRGGQGLDMGTFNRADEILREVGLEGVEKRLVGLPYDVELKGFEEGKRDVLREGRKAWRAAILKMMGGMLEGDGRKEEMMGEVERTTEAREGMWFPFVVVWGRRPE
ncbi:unnamed protein product [Zymoseptoria tritici ST99CH_1A5]|uniref:Methyltransferase type 11 domain-containing protein n=1 Tax=Zymoseptoria tritici ST99CH_1A5 TaxID=1276529 RepID=A0A1Y6LMR7_ZYMTR|nr:unnamed protein product [Zymoseptoria tritici ST99CH_1A5]